MKGLFLHLCINCLGRALSGARLGKIALAGPGLWSLAAYAPGSFPPAGERWKYLLLLARPKGGLVFPSEIKAESLKEAPAEVMWLRKRLTGRRVLGFRLVLGGRVLALELSPGQGAFLLLDTVKGPVLADEPPPGADPPDEPLPWTDSAIREILAGSGEAGLSCLAELTGSDPEAAWGQIRAIPGLTRAMGLPEDIVRAGLSVLGTAALWGTRLYFAALGHAAGRPAALIAKREQKRLARKRELLTADRKRLEGLCALRETADAVAGNLDTVDAKAKLDHIEARGAGGESRRIDFDPSLSVAANMDRLYRLAAKGKRGLAQVDRLEKELEAPGVGLGKPRPVSLTMNGKKANDRAKKPAPGIAVRRYTTTDGFTVYRGKNAKANHQLLTRLAGPFDLWFHAQDGPGAHVILKRDHQGVAVPRTSLEQAAALAALAGYAKNAASARVICALARDVRQIKGASLGEVSVDKVLESLVVVLDPDLESALRSG